MAIKTRARSATVLLGCRMVAAIQSFVCAHHLSRRPTMNSEQNEPTMLLKKTKCDRTNFAIENILSDTNLPLKFSSTGDGVQLARPAVPSAAAMFINMSRFMVPAMFRHTSAHHPVPPQGAK
jgi:hypothetical protein